MNAKMPAVDYGDAILASTDQGLFLVESLDKVCHHNAQLLELLGMKKMEIVGWKTDDLFRSLAALSRDPQRSERELRAAQANLPARTSIYILGPQEVASRLQVQIFSVPNDGQKSSVWGGLVRDVTAEWQEITYQAKYASILTRELRLPLAKLRGMMTTYIQNRSHWDETERQRFLDDMYKGVDHSTHLLEDVQEMLRVQSGTLSLNRQTSNIKAMVRKVLSSKAVQAAGRPLTENIPDGLPNAEVDPGMIEGALSAVLQNILQRSPSGSRVHLSVRAEHNEVIISIAGQSVNIPDAYLPHIFEPFNASTVGHLERVTEVGLGLYVAYELTLAHGGRMWAKNSPAQGLTIYMVLPLTAPSNGRLDTPKPALVKKLVSEAPAKVGKAHGTKTRILVVEDDFEVARLLKLVLERQGYDVLTVERGAQAIETVADKQPDLIVLDLQLPDINGLTVCKELREFTDIPIIILTANSKREDIAPALDMGADDYVTKPFNQVELGARIRATLRRASAREETAHNTSVYTVGDLSIDFEKRQVSLHGRRVKLTPTEYKVLYHLAVNPGQVLTHEDLLSRVWGSEFHDATQYLWVCISRLRKKLEADPAHPEYILTEQGIGYFLREASSLAVARSSAI